MMLGRSASLGHVWRRVFDAARPLKRVIPSPVRDGLRGWLRTLCGLPPLRVVHLPRKTGARRIVIDAEPLRHPRAGIGTYTYEITRTLLRLDRRSDYYLMNLAGDRGPVAVPRDVGTEGFSDWLQGVVGEAAPWRIPPPAVIGADLYFGPCFFGQFHASFRTIIAIHDMCYRFYPEETCPAIHPLLVNELPRQARLADAIVTISHSTRADVVKFLPVAPEKVRVTPLGVDPRFRPIHDPVTLGRVRRGYDLPERFVLSVGTLEPRKNIARLCEAFRTLWHQSGGRWGLVLTGGKGWKDGPLRQALREMPAGAVRLTGYVPDEDLPALYSLADAVAYPSLYEGFGLPVVEAMACGTPVVTSDRSSLPEVSGGAALLVDPMSPAAIAGALARVLQDESLRADAKRAGLRNAQRFSWEEAGQQTLALFDEVSSGRASVTP